MNAAPADYRKLGKQALACALVFGIWFAPIPAGLTNTNYRVEVDGTPYFVRIPGVDTDLLAVDRGNEIHNTIAAAEAVEVQQARDVGAGQ